MGEQGPPSDNPPAVDAAEKQKQYKVLYTATEANPHDEVLWDRIVGMAKQEEQTPPLYLPTVPIDEMIDVGRLLQHDTTQEARYHHLLQTFSNGRLWYDIIHGKENNKQLDPVFSLLDQEMRIRRRKFERGLDLGTGTGNVVQNISPYCDTFVGLDVLHEAVQKAGTRKDIGGVAVYVQSVATHLPFNKESFDLVISNGLTLYLPREQEWKQNEEINRVLKSGGMYVSIWLGKKEDIATMHIHGAKELLENIMSWMIVGNAPPASDQMGMKEVAGQFMSKGYAPIFPPEEGKNLVIGFRKK